MSPPPARSRGNRRITARWACRLTASYRVKDQWHPATAMDLSRLGCRLRLGERLGRGTRVSVRLECLAPSSPDGAAKSVELDGSVVWSRLEGLSHQCGIHFGREADEIEAFLQSSE
jgi:hypothetical protein